MRTKKNRKQRSLRRRFRVINTDNEPYNEFKSCKVNKLHSCAACNHNKACDMVISKYEMINSKKDKI